MDLIEAASENHTLLNKLYDDLAQPGMKQVGTALGTILGLSNTILYPISLLNVKVSTYLHNNLEKYRQKLENVPEDEICEISPEIGVPIIEQLSYTSNEKLGEMYVELLSKASQKSLAQFVHPHYVNLIKSLSPDEAVILKSYLGEKIIPFISIHWQVKGQNKWQEINPIMLDLPCTKTLHFPRNIHAYVNNLEGLGLLKVRNDIYLADAQEYVALENSAKSKYSHLEHKDENKTLVLRRGQIEISPLAQMFLKACLANTTHLDLRAV